MADFLDTPSSHSLWQQAASFAARRHRHGLRKDKETPYVAHPFRVCLTVRQVFGCDDDVALAAAILHDTIEDTCTDYDELHELFGESVADIVASLTKNMALREAQREREYDERLALADWRARLIKLADVYDNLADSLTGRGVSVSDVVEKIRRATSIAASDAPLHEPTRRALAALTQAVRRAGHDLP
jgi:(p)ppGpp synthase/HD superfamily hydrolase